MRRARTCCCKLSPTAAHLLQDLAPNLGPAGLNLLGQMLLFEPHTRISAAEACKHPYFHDIIPILAQRYPGL